MALKLKKLASPLLAASLMILPTANSFAEVTADPFNDGKPSALAMYTDLLLLRPLGIVATTVGAVAWVIGTPFTLPIGCGQEAADELVVEPFKYTFDRCLGCTRVGYHSSVPEQVEQQDYK